ncbi:MAG: hypothetical protein JW730_11095 [Anaerolineales bacterium]|nr:hypothetical protein [Anaerolineales bacterium]
MQTKSHSVKDQKTKSTRGKNPSASTAVQTRKDAEPKLLSLESLKKTIAYFYLLSYCPPAHIADFKQLTQPLRKALAESAGMKEAAYFKAAIPEVCRRIVAFHEGTREPSPFRVEALINTARNADKSPEKTLAFQIEVANVARIKQRALPENRLHRKKGCQFCRLPCHYGYFSLVSDPQFGQLRAMLAAEVNKPAPEQSPLGPVYGFAIRHIAGLTGTQEGFLEIEHLVNLSYCLLMLGMAKSRLAIPEEELRLFQAANQESIPRAGM